MSRRLYLHIGAPKTGTTYLQDRLTLNAKELARNGILFPTRSPLISPALFQFRAALDLQEQDWGGEAGHARGAWKQLVRRVQRGSQHVVVSHEILAPAKPHHIAKAVRDLSDFEVHVVYSARDLARQVPAAWQESIKQGRKWSYRRYLARFEHSNPWFARAFDLPQVLGAWGAEVPTERIHVVTVPHARGDALWLRFCEAFRIDPAWAPADSTRHNASLGVAETQLVRMLNRRMDRTTRLETSIDELIRTMLAEDRLLQRQSPALSLPPEMHGWATEQSQRWIDWLGSSGVQVIGDLDDLYPPPPPEKFVDPDRVRLKKQLNAALDALSAMTHEAARRQDPDDALVAKMRRATRPRDH